MKDPRYGDGLEKVLQGLCLFGLAGLRGVWTYEHDDIPAGITLPWTTVLSVSLASLPPSMSFDRTSEGIAFAFSELPYQSQIDPLKVR